MNPCLIVPSSAKQKVEYTATDKAVFLMREGTQLANLFEQSALIKQDARAIAISDLLRETYRPGNIYHASDLINYETGELFDGYGVLINSVNTRFSKAYLTASARRTRKRINAAIAEMKLYVGERYRFLTLTMPYLRVDVEAVLKIKDRALTLLKKRKLWTSNVRGAFIAEEMTIGDASTIIQTHYHAHAHALLVGKYIEQWRIADVWTECVEKACAEFGAEFLMRNLVTNRLSVDIRDVAARAEKNGTTINAAVEELCKYVVKGSDYEKVPTAELVEIERALFKRQMVKSYGDFNNQKGKGKKETVTERTSLDTKCITDGAVCFKTKQARRPSLVDTGVKMILDGRRSEWLQMVGIEMEYRREFRVEQLAWKFPHATFRTLNGGRWFGVTTRPPKIVVSLSDYKQKRTTSDNEAVSPYPRF